MPNKSNNLKGFFVCFSLILHDTNSVPNQPNSVGQLPEKNLFRVLLDVF